MRRIFFCSILILSLLFIFSCSGEKAPVEQLFSESYDTTKLMKLANFLSEEDIKKKVNIDNGLKTTKGIKPLPQDGDDFRFDTLDNRYWKGVIARKCDFRGASFRSSDCSESDFTGSDFRVSDIRWTSFFFSKMDSCDFSQSKMFHVFGTGGSFNDCKFLGANMFGMEAHDGWFRNCDFSNALMKDTEFAGSDFTGSKAVKVRFIRAVMKGAKMDTMDISFSDFTGSGLKDVSFKHSKLYKVNFQGAHLQNANFSGANLKGANFKGAEFKHTNFNKAINIPQEVKAILKNGFADNMTREAEN